MATSAAAHGRRRGRLIGSVAAAAFALPGCGTDVGQAVQDEAGKRATDEINRIVDSTTTGGRDSALRRIDQLEAAAKGSPTVEEAADRARAELERRTP